METTGPLKRPIKSPPANSPLSQTISTPLKEKAPSLEKEKKPPAFFDSMKIILTYLLADLKKKQRSFRIGLVTVLLVTACVTVLTSGVVVSPLIFMKLAENDVGETDAVLTPAVGSNRTELNLHNPSMINETSYSNYALPFLNHTELSKKIMGNASDLVRGMSPRWTFLGRMRNPTDPTLNVTCTLLIINSTEEINIALGRAFTQRVLGESVFFEETILTGSALRQIGVNPLKRDPVELYLNIYTFIKTFVNSDIDSQLTPGNLVSFLKSIGIAPNVTEHLHPTQDGGMSVNVYALANQNVALPADEEQRNQIENLINTLPTNYVITAEQWNQTVVPYIQDRMLVILQKYMVADTVSGNVGKWSATLGNVMLVDSAYVLDTAVQNLRNNLQELSTLLTGGDALSSALQNDTERLQNITLNHYAMTSNLIFHDRPSLYMKNINAQKHDALAIGRRLATTIGLDGDAYINLPMYNALKEYATFQVLLEVLFASIIFLLLFLSLMLIYSLMLTDVDERTFEFGMLRALGLKQSLIIGLVLVQAAMFAIPAVLIALAISYVLNLVVYLVLFEYTNCFLSFELPWVAITIGVCVGTVVPIIANTLPIQRALSKALHDALNLYHHAISDIYISIIKLENMGTSLTQALIGLSLVVCGFLAYYMVPYALVFNNNRLFFYVLNIILIGMIFGLIIIMHLFYPYVQNAIGHVLTFIFYRDRNLSCTVQNNLKGHMSRNSKTAFMYMIAITFAIFAGVTFTLQRDLIVSMLRMFLGADIVGVMMDYNEPLDEYHIRGFLNEMKQKGLVEDFTFISSDLSHIITNEATNYRYSLSLSSLAKFPKVSVEVYAVEKNYLRTINSDLYYPNEVEDITLPKLPIGELDAVFGLYSNESINTYNNKFDHFGVLVGADKILGMYQDKNDVYGSEIKILIPEGLRKVLSLDTQTKAFIGITGSLKGTTVYSSAYRAHVRAMITKIPGFYFSSYKQVSFYASIVLPMDQFAYIMNKCLEANPDAKAAYEKNIKDVNSTFDIPKQRVLVKTAPELELYERDVISNGIKSYFTSDASYLVDVLDLEKTANETLVLLEFFLTVVSAICLFLSFFLLLLSTISNVRENVWEFGVLRAVGLTTSQVSRIFIYESFSVIIAAVFLGFAVGVVVSITLTLQINMFMELPFKFNFPVLLVSVMLVITFLTTFAAAYFPSKILGKKQISDITKGNV